jgi:hypothetical protein
VIPKYKQFIPTKPHIRPWTLDWGTLWICEDPFVTHNGSRYCTGETPKEAYDNFVEEYMIEPETKITNT